VPERLDIRPPEGERAVDQIPGHDDQVDTETRRSLDDGVRPRHREKPADMEIGQLQDGVAVELPRQSANADLDVFQRRYTYGLIDGDRSQNAGHCGHRVANAVGHSHASTDQHPKQRGAIKQQLQQREEDDRAKQPVEEDDQRAWKFGVKHRARR
jgi:hypothetical protein